MTSLLRRVVATFVNPVDSAASSKPSSHPDTVDAPGPHRADGSPPRPVVVFAPPRTARDDTTSARDAAPPHDTPPPGTNATDPIPASSPATPPRPLRATLAATE